MQNQNYTINSFFFNEFQSHLLQLQNKYSKLFPVRLDFFYIKTSPLFNQRTQDWCCRDIALLSEELLQKDHIVGYVWVMELTQDHGLHFHALFYLNGQIHHNPHSVINTASSYWSLLTQGQGYYHDVNLNAKNYKNNGMKNLRYFDDNQKNNLLYALSYLAKEEQKDFFYLMPIYCRGLSSIEPPSGKGRPRCHIDSRHSQ